MIYPESPLTGYEYFELVCGCIFVILFLRILVWIKKNTLNFSFNNFPFSIIKLTIYLFLISGIIGVLSTMYHGINLLWEIPRRKHRIENVLLTTAMEHSQFSVTGQFR